MQILHILGDRKLARNADQNPISGIVRAVLEIAAAQVKLGHKVSVAVVGHDKWQSEWRKVQLYGLARASWAYLRVNGRSLDLRLHIPFVLCTYRNKFDVVQSHHYGYMRFLHAKCRIFHIHGDPFYKGKSSESIEFKRSDLDIIKKNSDAQVAISQFIAGELARGFKARCFNEGGNIQLVHNGIDTTHFNPDRCKNEGLLLRRKLGIPDRAFVFMFGGAITQEKGVIHLARAFGRIAANNPNVHLVLAGASSLWGGMIVPGGIHDEYEKEVKQTLHIYSETGQVHFLGKVPASQMAEVYSASDAVIVPSVCREGFGQVALEALAMARPVIASRTGGLVEFVNEQNGILVQPGDEAGLEVAMRTLVDNPALCVRMGAAARSSAQRFSWHKAAQQLDAIYHNVLAKKVR